VGFFGGLAPRLLGRLRLLLLRLLRLLRRFGAALGGAVWG
jgi:hypothetical protein